MGHDVIIVGARVAGAATAMLLARAGLDVVVVDRARFPSDTLSSHQVQVPGVALLNRWGLLPELVATGAPPTRRAVFHLGGATIDGHYPSYDGVDAMYSPRRTVLDAMLVEAARRAGAEVREATIVEGLAEDAGRVTGIRYRRKAGGRAVESAPLVIGADGKNSTVAETVGARATTSRSARTLACYAYWEGFELPVAEVHGTDRQVVGAWPTNDGLVITYVAQPADELTAFRRDPAEGLLAALARAGGLGERARAARRVSPVRATTDLPNVVRAAHGPGWALTGDAGLVMDPITGQGIGNAFRDAELLSGAVLEGLGGRRPLAAALAGYQSARDRQTRAMFDFTVGLASFRPVQPAEQRLFAAIAERPEESDRFLGVLSGVTPVSTFFSPAHLVRLVGVRGLLGLARARAGVPAGPRVRHRADAPPSPRPGSPARPSPAAPGRPGPG